MQIDVLWLAGIIGALSVIGGALFGVFRFIEQQKHNKQEIKAIKKEQALICYSLAVCIDGLHQLGANGEVTKASEKMKKFLNLAAHDEEG